MPKTKYEVIWNRRVIGTRDLAFKAQVAVKKS